MRFWTSHTFIEDLYAFSQSRGKTTIKKARPLVASAIDDVLYLSFKKIGCKAPPKHPFIAGIYKLVHEYIIPEKTEYRGDGINASVIGPIAEDAYGHFPIWKTDIKIMSNDRSLVERTRDLCLTGLRDRNISFGGVGNLIYDTVEYARQMKGLETEIR